MSSNDETHILNLIRNLLLEEKERERMSSLRGTHSDALSLSDQSLMSQLAGNQSLPSIGSLSELIAHSGGHPHQTHPHHHQSHVQQHPIHTSIADYQGLGQAFSLTTSRPSTQPNLSFLNLNQFEGHSSAGQQSIDDLLGLGSGAGGRSSSSSSGAIPPLVPPLPQSSIMSQSSRQSSDDSSDAGVHHMSPFSGGTTLGTYASLVGSGGGQGSQSMSSQLPFILDSLSSPVSSICSGQSSSSATLMSRFESQVRTIANDIQTTIQLHMNGLQMRKEHLLKQLEHIKQTYSTVLSMAAQSSDESVPLPLPQITFTRPDSALYKAVTTLGFLTTPALAVNCTANGDGVEMAIEGEATCFTITTRNCFNEELLIGMY